MPENLVDDYGWETPVGPHSCDYLVPEVIACLKSMGAQRVLDVGSGNGSLCAALKAEGFSVAGVEYDIHGVQIARAHHPQIHFHHFGVQDDPAKLLEVEGQFDAVVSTEVIEHLFSPQLLPQYALPLLKPGGSLVITTPYHGYLKNLALAVANKWDHHHDPLWQGGHIKFFSRATLTRLLEDNGFEPHRFRGVGRAPYLWKSMLLVARPS